MRSTPASVRRAWAPAGLAELDRRETPGALLHSQSPAATVFSAGQAASNAASRLQARTVSASLRR
jgi:hypothetical protein